jgi:hypothetical protein
MSDRETITDGQRIASAIRDCFMANHDDDNVVDALLAIHRSIDRLGNADAGTPMGGLEALGKVLGEGLKAIAGAIEEYGQIVERGDEPNTGQ